jgi:hypothetical protein
MANATKNAASSGARAQKAMPAARPGRDSERDCVTVLFMSSQRVTVLVEGGAPAFAEASARQAGATHVRFLGPDGTGHSLH